MYWVDFAIVWCGIKTTPHWDEFWKLERNDKIFGKKMIIFKKELEQKWGFFNNLAKIDDFWKWLKNH